jgi:hypothetical protein
MEDLQYRFKISLRLRHPLVELRECSSEFGLEPLREWTAGESRTSSRGKALGGVWDHSYWTAPLDVRPEEDLETALNGTSHWLNQHVEFLVRHRGSGGSASLFIGLFLEGFNSGFSLDPSLLVKYAVLGVALEFDMYGPDSSPHAA